MFAPCELETSRVYETQQPDKRWKTQKRNDSLVALQMLTTRPFALQRRAEPVYTKKIAKVTCRTPNQPPDKTVGSPIR
jgi:hypothetical protein